MTREDLLKGNCQIAAEFGDNIKKYCPDVNHVVVIFNPADVTALTALIRSGLKPSQLTSLAALDSTRLQSAIAKELGVPQYKVENARTYGGHGEAMAVFASKITVDGKPLAEYNIPEEKWAEIKHATIQGGSNIIKLRGRSSFQSPSYQSVLMIQAAMGGAEFHWPAGCYVNNEKYKNVLMAMPTTIDATGVHFGEVTGSEEEIAALDASYAHLQVMRDEIISLGIIPPVSEWNAINPNL
jgi:malate dehydrogenase